MRTALFLVLAVAASGALAQQYRWVDEKGRVQYSDAPPPASARSVQKKEFKGNVVSSETPFELQLATKNAPVTLYTAPECKEGCSAARAALNKRGVPFKEIQVWEQETNDLLKKISGSNEVPVLQVGSSVQKGFEQGAFDRLLDVAGYPKVGSLPVRKQAQPPAPEGYQSAEPTGSAPAPAAPDAPASSAKPPPR